MSRKRRHIRARHDEWVVVHRDPKPSDSNPLGCLILIIIVAILLHSC